ncbi:1,4-dihydroxy-2-naphthoate octaprenyltransferase [Streptomyces sp. S4.7]|uniref:UbiA family prenyltransferase n=1 Tax=Streptomyces sp. S4.7 TaxID=2705439 RepID=UPI001397F665|nr:UbiA family prenyltransferase [Streptomyces sp. S4.7]QHY96167.1 1,4-dihydroxy-2-naphthoate octaprenyltransferase [Streptomyces sp. S4.7]
MNAFTPASGGAGSGAGGRRSGGGVDTAKGTSGTASGPSEAAAGAAGSSRTRTGAGGVTATDGAGAPVDGRAAGAVASRSASGADTGVGTAPGAGTGAPASGRASGAGDGGAVTNASRQATDGVGLAGRSGVATASAAGTDGTGPAGAPASGARGRFVAYARLAKFEFVLDYYLSMLVLWTALAGSVRFASDTWTTLLLFLLGEIGVISAVMALDDVNGIKDGSDRANYLGTGGTPLRPLERKPLLTGALTVPQATRFGYLSLLWGTVFWSASAFAAPERPLWALVVTGLVLFAGFQYSWGLKLSYRGLGEVLIMGCPLVIVVAPYGFVTGHLPAIVLVQAVLFGLWQILVSCYSNTKDISGDAAVGRSTVAVHTSARGNLVFIGALSAVDLLLTVGASAVGWAPWWFFAALLPEMALRLRQFTSFSRNGDALLARRRGVVAFRTGVAGIVLANLIHFAS